MGLEFKIPELTQEDLILYEIVRHPVFFGEFVKQLSQTEKELEEEPFIWSDYQDAFLCDFNDYVSICCGRSVGKTEALVALFLWLLINNIFPGDYVLYTVPSKAHLQPVWTNLTRALRSNPLLRHYIEPNKGINGADFSIKLTNGAVLLCRIAGTSGGGANVIGLHSPFEIIDEASYYPWGTWVELQPTGNTFTLGFRRVVSGVPTGQRERNVLFHVDIENSLYTKHRIPAQKNPRYSKEDEKRDLKQYGGKDGEDYLHLVLGRHGRPVYSVFDRDLMKITTYPVYQLAINGIQLANNLDDYITKLSLFPLIDKEVSDVIFGIDLGYTDPTAILILYKDIRGRFKFHGRIKLTKVPYPIQSRIIDYLDTRFSPSLLGIDEGNVGKAEIQKLQMNPEYASKNYKKRLIPIDFNSNIILGTDEEGKEIKSRTKPFSVTLLQEYTNNHRIIYSTTDFELISELERMTYMRTDAGNMVYKTLTPKGGKKGSDHFTAALLCAIMAYYLEHEKIGPVKEKRILMKAGWNK